MSPVNVTKASGEKEPYDESKLRRSLQNAGADKRLTDKIADAIRGQLHEGISTQKLYSQAFKMLKQQSSRFAGRYKLKEALLELGPTGYPFEKFIGELLARLGYQTKVGQVVEGNCVSHEIDVIAQKEDAIFIVECKFHNRKAHKCNVQVPLYIQSRFEDVHRRWSNESVHQGKKHFGWVITNTRFTGDATEYANCMGLKLMSWDYPKNNGLKDLISRVNLHPVTCLSSLNKKEKKELLKHDVVFCKQLYGDGEMLNRIGIDNRKRNRIIKEAEEIYDRNNGAL